MVYNWPWFGRTVTGLLVLQFKIGAEHFALKVHSYYICIYTYLYKTITIKPQVAWSINILTYWDSVVLVYLNKAFPSTNVAIRVRVIATQLVNNSLGVHIKVVIKMTVPPVGTVDM